MDASVGKGNDTDNDCSGLSNVVNGADVMLIC